MMKNLRFLASLALVFVISSTAYAQNGVLRGTVKDASGQPLVGSVVSVDGTRLSALVDEDGSYRISIAPGNYDISANLMGYKKGRSKTTLTAGSDAVVNFTLLELETSLDEVIVIGYGQSNTKDLTGSLVSVKARSFQKGAFVSPEAMIIGKTPGVRITSYSGQPGSGSRIRIRGGSSINASNDPLVVIDGFPSNGLGLINPSDIESFTILKDASATAIYGSRAANGVILVTTKKGVAGQPFSADVSIVNSVRQIRNQVDVLSADEFRALITEKGTNAQRARLATADSTVSTNWQDQIYQTGMVKDVNLALTGGMKNLPYRLSMGYYNETGVLKRSELTRFSLSLNASPSLIKGKLKANVSTKLLQSENFYANQGSIGGAVTFDPTRPVLSGDTTFGGYYEWLRNGLPNALSPKNPVGLIEQREDVGYNTRALGNVLFDYTVLSNDNLHFYVNLGGEHSFTHGNGGVPASAASNYFSGGEQFKYESTRTNRLLETYFQYKKTLGAMKNDLTGGYSFQHWSTSSPSFPVLNASGSDTLSPANPFPYFTENALMSFYGRWNTNINNKYLMTATLRSDGSSRFSKESRWGLFPSAALGWNLLEEGFMNNNELFTTFKMRAGWGITGQQDIFNDYAYVANYAYSASTAQYQFGNNWVSMLRPDAYDYNLQWEKTATTNVGVDYGFYKNRLFGSLDFYSKNTYDLLGVIPIPAGTNFSNRVLTNVGAMVNNGFEGTVNYVAINTPTTTLEIGLNGSINRNKITKLALVQDPNDPGIQVGGISGGVGNSIQIHSVGNPMFTFYAYNQLYDANGKPIEKAGVLENYAGTVDVNGNGKIDDIEAYEDLNGDGLINTGDLMKFSNCTPDPREMLGLSLNFNHKRWSGGATLRAEFGQYVYNNIHSTTANYFAVGGSQPHLSNLTRDYLITGFKSPQYLSSYYIEDASFLRIDNFYLSYNLGKLYKDRFASSLNLSIQNALVITKYSGLDPEIAGGIDNNMYPRPRVFNLQLNVQL